MSKSQMHKRLTQEQVVLILENYLSREIALTSALENLGLKRARFFRLLKAYQDNPEKFAIIPRRDNAHRKITKAAETLIKKELQKEQKLIQNKDMPIRSYNYSAVADDLLTWHQVKVSVPTIINRAKDWGYYLPRKPRRVHDRVVLTNFAGELVQHDSSHHLWSPFMDQKLYLITSLDDYSRLLLYADLVENETSWTHILAVESVIMRYGCPLKYYPDQHSVFRYVKNRDQFRPHQTYSKFTDDVDTQFKQVLKDCGTDLIYALSPQAKGKIERPYGWLQDRIVRTCAKEKIMKLAEVRDVLKELVYQYNHRWVHSTTKDIPAARFEKAREEGKSLLRPFVIKSPFESSKDIFCLREQRVVNNYRKISLHNLELTVPNVPPRYPVDLRIVPNAKVGLTEVRMWFKGKLVSTQLVKNQDLGLVYL